MLFIYLLDGECIEVEGATLVETKNGTLYCYDRFGKELASFPADEVELYTFNEREAQAIEEEACDDVTVVGDNA